MKKRLCQVSTIVLLTATLTILLAGWTFGAEAAGTYKITNVNTFSAVLELTLSETRGATHYNVFKRTAHTLVSPLPVSCNEKIGALPGVYVNVNDLIIRTYGDSAGTILIGEYLLNESGQLVAVPAVSQSDCDLNMKVDLRDLTLLALAYGSTYLSTDGRWNQQCDLNGDDQVSLLDLVQLARSYGHQ